MHDTDMAGILYFAKQFRYVHDALEDLVEKEGFSFDYLFHNSEFVFVIVHAEADYLASVKVGDLLEVHVEVENMGNTSFTVAYKIFKANDTMIGKAKTVHVCLDAKNRQKIAIPDALRNVFKKYQAPREEV